MARRESQEFIPDSQPSPHPVAPAIPSAPTPKQHWGTNTRVEPVSVLQGHNAYPPIVPRQRSPSPDELLEARAQLHALRRNTRDNQLIDLRKQIAELQGAESGKPKDEGTDPRLLPLKAHFSAVKPKYIHQVLEDEFDPVNVIRLCNDVSISRAQSKYIDLGKNLEVKMKDEDASEFDIKGLATLIRCLDVLFPYPLLLASHMAYIGIVLPVYTLVLSTSPSLVYRFLSLQPDLTLTFAILVNGYKTLTQRTERTNGRRAIKRNW
ncbi:hypothetical protein MMC07_001879 [Pseudocyphellaria aurata]|nr:hypothetical protein [Pseudocyphellaria aurata]